MLAEFDTVDLEREGVRLAAGRAGNGPPLLLLHGHPQTHAMWHLVAPRLARHFTVVWMDLRGYGDSALAMYENTSRTFATAYWHWFFLIQPPPLPEALIDSDPVRYLRSVMGKRHAGLDAFAPAALAEYERCIQLAGSAQAICGDYRASAAIDLEHDRADIAAGRRLEQPLRVLWGEHGAVGTSFDVLGLWRERASQVSGHSLGCGHYIAEEAPALLLDEAMNFLRRTI